jgi:tetratricopeptide (TPR) repeat protein
VQYFEKADITGLDDAFKQILNYYSGKAYKNLGNVDKASPLLEKTVSASKKSDYAAFGYIELGDIASDNTDFAKSADYYNKAAQAAVTPETAAIALYKKGQVEFMGGAYEISLETFKKLLDSGQVAPDMYGKALANYLLCLYNLEMYKNVIQEYAGRTKDVDQGTLPFDVYYVLASSYDEIADTKRP